MATRLLALPARKRIALVAHDHEKPRLLRWARRHRRALARHTLVATGTTGAVLVRQLGLSVEARLLGRRATRRPGRRVRRSGA